jgi:hypothetical protein
VALDVLLEAYALAGSVDHDARLDATDRPVLVDVREDLALGSGQVADGGPDPHGVVVIRAGATVEA